MIRDRRFFGSTNSRIGSEPRTQAWERGASGERIVGAHLDRIDAIEVLHDRRIPGTRATIDHIAVGPGGVYVVDAKLYGGGFGPHTERRVPRRASGLFSGDRERTKPVARLRIQVIAIARALGDTPIPITPALCCVETQAAVRPEPFVLDGVWVGTPDALPDLVGRPGLLDREAIHTATRLLDTRLPPS